MSDRNDVASGATRRSFTLIDYYESRVWLKDHDGPPEEPERPPASVPDLVGCVDPQVDHRDRG